MEERLHGGSGGGSDGGGLVICGRYPGVLVVGITGDVLSQTVGTVGLVVVGKVDYDAWWLARGGGL